MPDDAPVGRAGQGGRLELAERCASRLRRAGYRASSWAPRGEYGLVRIYVDAWRGRQRTRLGFVAVLGDCRLDLRHLVAGARRISGLLRAGVSSGEMGPPVDGGFLTDYAERSASNPEVSP